MKLNIRRYPIGIQNFEQLRNRNCVYVDKIDILKRSDFDVRKLNGLTATDEQFDTPTEQIVDPIPVLYQSGYLTIKGYDPTFKLYKLAYPNSEVRYGFTESLLPSYVH